MSMSIRSRLVLGTILMLSLWWIATTLAVRFVTIRYLDESIDSDLRSSAESVSGYPASEIVVGKVGKTGVQASDSVKRTEDPATAFYVDVDDTTKAFDGIKPELTVYPKGGKEIVPKSDSIAIGKTNPGGTTTRPPDTIEFGLTTKEFAGAREFSRPLIIEGEAVGVVKSSYPLSTIRRLQKSLDFAMLLILPVGIVAFAGYGWWSIGRALKPIQDIAASATQINAKSLDTRLPEHSSDEFGQLSSAFNAMFDRLDRSFKAQEQFISDASHELRTPLAIIKANLAWASRTSTSSELSAEAISDATRAASRMQSLIDDLLELAKSEHDTNVHQAEPIPISEPLLEVIRDFQDRCGFNRINHEIDGEVMLGIKPLHIQRILHNLLENAEKYTPLEKQITVTVTAQNGEVLLSVADEGPGIDPQHLTRLGERFFRPDTSRSQVTGGTGLGLAIVRSLAEAYGGKLEIQSELGQGTTANVRFK